MNSYPKQMPLDLDLLMHGPKPMQKKKEKTSLKFVIRRLRKMSTASRTPEEETTHEGKRNSAPDLETDNSSPKQMSPKRDSFQSSPVSSKAFTESSSVRNSETKPASHSMNKTFHRRFLQIDGNEELIDYFSCALVADILLQGFLYISENHFAFYSNIFGYKTKLLIPISDVIAVTKEKTVKIIPNAVGICTAEGKYVFGSLLSRESTFRVMYTVWSSYVPMLNLESLQLLPQENGDTGSDSQSTPTHGDSNNITNEVHNGCNKIPPIVITPEDRQTLKRIMTSSTKARETLKSDDSSTDTESLQDYPIEKLKSPRNLLKHRPRLIFLQRCSSVKNLFTGVSRRTILLTVATLLIAFLFASAAVLLYRINNLHDNLIRFVSNKRQVSKTRFVKQELEQMAKELKLRIQEISLTKDSLSSLLTSIEKLAAYFPGNARNTAVIAAASRPDQCPILRT